MKKTHGSVFYGGKLYSWYNGFSKGVKKSPFFYQAYDYRETQAYNLDNQIQTNTEEYSYRCAKSDCPNVFRFSSRLCHDTPVVRIRKTAVQQQPRPLQEKNENREEIDWLRKYLKKHRVPFRDETFSQVLSGASGFLTHDVPNSVEQSSPILDSPTATKAHSLNVVSTPSNALSLIHEAPNATKANSPARRVPTEAEVESHFTEVNNSQYSDEPDEIFNGACILMSIKTKDPVFLENIRPYIGSSLGLNSTK